MFEQVSLIRTNTFDVISWTDLQTKQIAEIVEQCL